MNNREKGLLGENMASEFLSKKGYRIIDRNYRTKIGEIDIVAKKDNILVFVEVKTRANTNYGFPYEAVNRKKLNRIVRTSFIYMKENKYVGYQMRYDIIEVFLSNSIKINHIENVFCI